ncbi:hypothetical protein [Laspinema olomoucense]|uniref:hypothetical protein n=1 Tax=Laspinema olomoucense TaxID=3231600 RepID=UPI0021BB9B19|nr:hypothetical protein [Laspinema sp. D3c]MCT7992405.1 hypothetical protein [Laspinema sp. D3c]
MSKTLGYYLDTITPELAKLEEVVSKIPPKSWTLLIEFCATKASILFWAECSTNEYSLVISTRDIVFKRVLADPVIKPVSEIDDSNMCAKDWLAVIAWCQDRAITSFHQ